MVNGMTPHLDDNSPSVAIASALRRLTRYEPDHATICHIAANRIARLTIELQQLKDSTKEVAIHRAIEGQFVKHALPSVESYDGGTEVEKVYFTNLMIWLMAFAALVGLLVLAFGFYTGVIK